MSWRSGLAFGFLFFRSFSLFRSSPPHVLLLPFFPRGLEWETFSKLAMSSNEVLSSALTNGMGSPESEYIFPASMFLWAIRLLKSPTDFSKASSEGASAIRRALPKV